MQDAAGTPDTPSFETLLAFLRHTPMLAWTTDADGVFHYANDAFHWFVGADRTVEGRSVEDLFPAEMAATYRLNNETVLATGAPLLTEEVSVGRDGRDRTYSVVKFPVRTEGGTPLVGGMALDMTEQIRAQRALASESARYRRLVAWLGNRFFVYSYRPSDNVPVFISGDTQAIFGVSRAEALRRPFPELIEYHPDDVGRVFEGQAALLAGHIADVQGETRIHHPQKGWRVLRYHSHAVRDTDGVLVAVDGVLEDVTEERTREAEREAAGRALERRLAALDQQLGQLALLREMSDLLQVCRSVREGFDMLPGPLGRLFPGFSGGLYSVDEVRGQCRLVAAWGRHPPSQARFPVASCWALRRGRATRPPELVHGATCAHEGLPAAVTHAFCVPVVSQRSVVGLLFLCKTEPEDIREGTRQVAQSAAEQIGLGLANLALRETLQARALTDPLTGLGNRRALDEGLPSTLMVAEEEGVPVGLIMVDLDHFKRCNDRFGHEAGDQVLASVGALIRGHVRKTDLACRFGGEEMVLVFPGAGLEETVRRAEELRASIRDLLPRFEGESMGRVTASMGVAVSPRNGVDPLALIGAADAALYAAKAAGRDRVVVAPSG